MRNLNEDEDSQPGFSTNNLKHETKVCFGHKFQENFRNLEPVSCLLFRITNDKKTLIRPVLTENSLETARGRRRGQLEE